MPRIIRAEPYLAVGDDDMAEKEPAEGQAYPDCAMCAPCPKCDDEHDCGEDCCACLYPEPNVRCDICDGKGYWFVEATEENMKKLNKAGLEYGDWEP